MATDLRGGDRSRFDVLNIDVSWTSEFAAAGWIRPLTRDRFPLDRRSCRRSWTPRPTTDRLYAVPYVTNAGLLLYRKDVLAEEGVPPPRTWAELERDAKTIAPEARARRLRGPVPALRGPDRQRGRGRLLGGRHDPRRRGRPRSPSNSAAAREGIGFLARGVREGWIRRQALTYKEEESKQAFQDGRLLFLRNWPYAYAVASAPGSPVAGKVGAVPLPGPARAGHERPRRLQPGRQHPCAPPRLGRAADRLPDQRAGPAPGPHARRAAARTRRAVPRPRAGAGVPVSADPARERAPGRAAPQEPALRPGQPGRAGGRCATR